MNGLQELIDWCISNKAWLTVNYSPFDNAYKVFVNPGRTMTSARWYKDLDEAVKACWVAIGGKPLTVETLSNALVEYKDKCDEMGIPCTVNPTIAYRKRGRPKGSRNKPKVNT